MNVGRFLAKVTQAEACRKLRLTTSCISQLMRMKTGHHRDGMARRVRRVSTGKRSDRQVLLPFGRRIRFWTWRFTGSAALDFGHHLVDDRGAIAQSGAGGLKSMFDGLW